MGAHFYKDIPLKEGSHSVRNAMNMRRDIKYLQINPTINLDEEQKPPSNESTLSLNEDCPRKTRKRQLTYQYQVVDSDTDSQEQPQEAPSPSSFIRPVIEAAISKRQTQEGLSFLVKFKGKSYYRCKWLNEAEMKELGFDLDGGKKKSLVARMGKVQRLRLQSEHHFNPNYLVPDRILSSTDLFAAIQPKKANQVKGTWQESLQLVISKLLNFEKNMCPYGTFLLDEHLEEDPKKNGLSLPTVLNRVYFGLYQDYQAIWSDIGKTLSSFLRKHQANHPDYTIIANTLREAVLFLYLQWHTLSLQRYMSLQTQEINLEEQTSPPPTFSPQIDRQREYCLRNVLMTSKVAQKPKTEGELQRLNPRSIDCSWLEMGVELPFRYEWLEGEDMKQLDLNVESDRFYLVKWKEMSYGESNWEKESVFGHPQKIEEFMSINKMPNKDTREGLESNLKMHRELLAFKEKNKELLEHGIVRKPPLIEFNQEKLYLFKPAGAVPAKTYRGKDVITFKNYRLLKEFQNESLNWLVENWYQNRNCILADEMGLGKTIQIIAFLYHLIMNEKVLGPFLVLAPLTTLQQWRREIEAWTSFNCLLYYDEGQGQGLDSCQQHEFHYLYTRRNGEITKSQIPKFTIFLTNYESFIRHFQIIKDIPFQHIVVDEAHKMKNPKTALSLCLRALPCPRATLLTGTPLQNTTRQLWSLLNYLHPSHFPHEEGFVAEYGSLSTGNVERLKKVLRPYLLRRVKEDVEKMIPKLSQVIIDVEMTKTQKKVYKGLLERNKNEIIKGLSNANLNNLAMQFRKCCNHPFLISPQLESSLLQEAETPEKAFLDSSGKVILLLKLLTKFQQQGKKTLIFSQFVAVLELLQEHLEKASFRCELLHGGVSAADRTRAISRFCEDQQVQVFLISTKAGGVGINLTAATEIVIFDSDWNPQNDIQATARAHRIGQKQEVTVYRLITNNSYESEMFRVASRKLGMDKAIFNGDFFKKGKGEEIEERMSKEEVEMLLRKGVLGFIEGNSKDEEFFKLDIDEIIEKKSKRVEYSLGKDKNYTYSKSKFVGDHTATSLDVNSDNFWQVALKDIESPIQKLSKKLDNLEAYSDLESQEQLMLELTAIVSQFVKIRVTASSFNAEEERIMLSILSSISSQRTINRHYRRIADRLMEEIEKPSRRFKVSAQHILNVRTNRGELESQEEEEEEEEREEESPRHQILLREARETRGKGKNKKEEKWRTRGNQEEEKEEEDWMESSSIRRDYQSVCFVCLKPKCSIFCSGTCGRSFHSLCWTNYLKDDTHMTEAIALKEMGMKVSTWTSQVNKQLKCRECESGEHVCFCSICGARGTLDEKAEVEDAMTQCKNRLCKRFYHIQCLSESESFGWLIELANKRSQGEEGISLDRLVCPVHMCFGCGERVAKAQWNSLHSCIKCCKTFHPKCLSTAAHFVHLNESYYVCEEHLSRAQRNALVREYKLINADRKDIIELRKTEKMGKQGRHRLKNQKLPTEEELSYTYADFQLTPIDQFDFRNYDQLWCRYCGSRFAESFQEGPWGASSLCLHHSKLWKKGKLDLSEHSSPPGEPIFRKSTELKYLNRMAGLRKIGAEKLVDDLIRTQYNI